MCDTGEVAGRAASLQRARASAGSNAVELHVASRHECWEVDAWCKVGEPCCALGASLKNTPCEVCGIFCACAGCLMLIIALPACIPRRRMRLSYVALVTTQHIVTTEELGVGLCGEEGDVITDKLSVASVAAVEAQWCCCASNLDIFLKNEQGERRTKLDCCGNVVNAPADQSIICLEDAGTFAAAIAQAKLTSAGTVNERRASHQGAGLRAAPDATSSEFRVNRAAVSGSAKELYAC